MVFSCVHNLYYEIEYIDKSPGIENRTRVLKRVCTYSDKDEEKYGILQTWCIPMFANRPPEHLWCDPYYSHIRFLDLLYDDNKCKIIQRRFNDAKRLDWMETCVYDEDSFVDMFDHMLEKTKCDLNTKYVFNDQVLKDIEEILGNPKYEVICKGWRDSWTIE